MNTNYEAMLNEAFGRHVGLNADWSGTAWCVCHDGSGPNRGTGLYITDNENGTLSLVRRDFETESDIEEIESVDVSQVSNLIQQAITRRNALRIAQEAARRVFEKEAGPVVLYVTYGDDAPSAFIPIAANVEVVFLDTADPAPETYYHDHGREHPRETYENLVEDVESRSPKFRREDA